MNGMEDVRQAALTTLLLIVLFAAFGLAGTLDYEDRVNPPHPSADWVLD